MGLVVKAKGSLPAGAYEAELISVEEFRKGKAEFGPACEFRWRVTSPKADAGKETSSVCSLTLTPGSRLGKLVAPMRNGRPIAVGEEIDLTKFVGQKHHLAVAEFKQGMTRVESVLLVKDDE